LTEVKDDVESNTENFNYGSSVLISGDSFFKIFKVQSPAINEKKIIEIFGSYKKGQLSILLDIELSYNDEITGRSHSTNRIYDIQPKILNIIKMNITNG